MIKMLSNGELDLSVLEIKDVIDIELLQRFQDNFATGMNIASVTVDKNGTPVTNPSSYTRFCIDYTHSTKIGRGFGVVATEIRTLSQNSKETALKIIELTNKIQESVNKTMDTSNSTLVTTEQQSAAIEEVTASLQEVARLAEELNSMAKHE